MRKFKAPTPPTPFPFFGNKDEEDDDLDEDICPLSKLNDGKHQAKVEADIEACHRKIGVKACTDCTAWPYGRSNA